MSKLAGQLRAIKVFNNFELLRCFGRDMDVVIEYHRRAEGRMGWCELDRTTVWSPLPNAKLAKPRRALAAIVEKEFHGLRKESLPQAIAWAAAEFGHDYVPSPFGGYIPQHVLHHASQAAKSPSSG